MILLPKLILGDLSVEGMNIEIVCDNARSPTKTATAAGHLRRKLGKSIKATYIASNAPCRKGQEKSSRWSAADDIHPNCLNHSASSLSKPVRRASDDFNPRKRRPFGPLSPLPKSDDSPRQPTRRISKSEVQLPENMSFLLFDVILQEADTSSPRQPTRRMSRDEVKFPHNLHLPLFDDDDTASRRLSEGTVFSLTEIDLLDIDPVEVTESSSTIQPRRRSSLELLQEAMDGLTASSCEELLPPPPPPALVTPSPIRDRKRRQSCFPSELANMLANMEIEADGI